MSEQEIKSEEQVADDVDLNPTQFFQSDPKNYKMPCDPGLKKRHWRFIVYQESAPDNWIERLQDTGLPFVVSPLHDKDVNADGTPKKPHWHVIITYANTTTYQSIIGLRTITNGPYPLPCDHVPGAYAYLTHKHNPEKYQYDPKQIHAYNGWVVTLTTDEIDKIKDELTDKICEDFILEYADFALTAKMMGSDYSRVAKTNTMYFQNFIRSLRHNPYNTLYKYADRLKERDEPGDKELSDKIMKNLKNYEQQKQKQTYQDQDDNWED